MGKNIGCLRAKSSLLLAAGADRRVAFDIGADCPPPAFPAAGAAQSCFRNRLDYIHRISGAEKARRAPLLDALFQCKPECGHSGNPLAGRPEISAGFLPPFLLEAPARQRQYTGIKYGGASGAPALFMRIQKYISQCAYARAARRRKKSSRAR